MLDLVWVFSMNLANFFQNEGEKIRIVFNANKHEWQKQIFVIFFLGGGGEFQSRNEPNKRRTPPPSMVLSFDYAKNVADVVTILNS